MFEATHAGLLRDAEGRTPWSAVTEMVGALAISRAVSDPLEGDLR